MKKLLSLALILVLVLSLGLIAYAEEVEGDEPEMSVNCWWPPGWPGCDPDPEPEEHCVTIKKLIEVYGGSGSPAETFKFKITSKDCAPYFGVDGFEIILAENVREGSICLPLPTFDRVGVHEYYIKEIAGNTAGMDYDTKTLILRIYVLNGTDGEFEYTTTLREEVCGQVKKTDTFINKFYCGNLEVEKSVRGNFGDKKETFKVKVELQIPTGKILRNTPIILKPDGTSAAINFTGGKATAIFEIKDKQVYTFENLPKGVTWKVTEIDKKGHTDTYENKQGTVSQGTVKSLVIDSRHKEIETGVNLDSVPYILLMIGAVAGLGSFTKKRKY